MRKKKQQAPEGAQEAQPRRITPVDIQQKEFRLAFRGYNERDVDAFLDEVTEEVARLYAENKRLREHAEYRGTLAMASGNAAEAEEILRRAREEAARIVEEARARAEAEAQLAASTEGANAPSLTSSGIGDAVAFPAQAAPGSTAMVNAFLGKEREFLQTLASLIQSHAESVKEEVQRLREATVAPPAPELSEVEEAKAGEGMSSSPAADLGASGAGQQQDRDAAAPPTVAWTPSFLEEAPPETESRDGGVAIDQERAEPPSVRTEDPTGREGAPELRPASVSSPSSSAVRSVAVSPSAARPLEPAPAPRRPEPDEDEGEDRSLSELFWGED